MSPITQEPVDRTHDHERLLELEERAAGSDLRQMFVTLLAFLALGAAVTAAALIVAFGGSDDSSEPVTALPATPAQPAAGHESQPQTGAEAVKAEPYKTPDATLPAVPWGAVKRFRVDVFEHGPRSRPTFPPRASGRSASTACCTAAPASPRRWWWSRGTRSRSPS